jgi:carbonic anhydrase
MMIRVDLARSVRPVRAAGLPTVRAPTRRLPSIETENVICPSVAAERMRAGGVTGHAEVMFPLGPDPTAPPTPSSAGFTAAAPGMPQFTPAGLELDPGAAQRYDPSSEPLSEPSYGPAACARPPGPDGALAALLAGNERFVAGRPRYGHSVAAAVSVAVDPAPYAVVVGCIDSRLPIEAIFDQDFGTVCVVRSAGHVLDRATMASVEFAVETLGTELVLVLGHSRCAAVSAAVESWRTGRYPHGHLAYVAEEIGAAIHDAELGRPDLDDRVVRRHTMRAVARLRALLGADAARVEGAYYDVGTGRVDLSA